MTQPPRDDWSPLDHPYAIAVSESQWWRSAVKLSASRLTDQDDPRSMPMSSRQIDARQLIFALSQLLRAENLGQSALKQFGLSAASRSLGTARNSFMKQLEGIESMRNALTHYDEWSRGTGRGPQAQRITAGTSERDAAREFWGFKFDLRTSTISFGPYEITAADAVDASNQLADAIYLAMRAVDQLRAKSK